MVNQDIADVARRLSKRKILVTGGSGFVGSRLAKTLATAGHDVIASGTNPYRFPFGTNSARFMRCDIRDAKQLEQLISDRDLVYHCAALASPWGPRSIFEAINVQGTQNVVAACQKTKVTRLVHVSSTAVQFDFCDAQNVTEDDANANPFACEYARSKAMAEDIVRAASTAGLNTVIIRARAVFGPGDRSLVPRLVQAAKTGRLRKIGNGKAILDFTYIDNLLYGLVLAADAGHSGTTYTITNDEPVNLWTFIDQTIHELDCPPVTKRISRRFALGMATTLERSHRWLKKTEEPVTTRYSIGLLSTTKTFDILAAKRDLRYKPIIHMLDAHRQTIKHLKATDDSPADVCVGLKLFSTGYTSAKAHLAEHGGARAETIRFHAMIGVIDHPEFGLTLFDTGYSPRFFEATSRLPYRLYRWTTPVVTNERLAAVEVLRSNGIDPADIRRILLSHFHADHTCGLRDFPGIDVICAERSFADVKNAKGMGAVKRAFLPGLMPHDLHQRTCPIDHFHDPGMGPFQRTHDLFGDRSVRLVDLSGHAPGQVGVIVQRGVNDRVLLTADACWTTPTITKNLPLTLPFRLLASDKHQAKQTIQRLHDFHSAYPDVELIPTHCPQVAERYGFDFAVKNATSSAGLDSVE